jgi:hypothetical protein
MKTKSTNIKPPNIKSANIKKLDLTIEWDADKLRNLMTNAKR